MNKNKSESTESAIATALRFHQRYINLAAITTDGRTISSQAWVKDQQDVYDAEAVLVRWCLPAEEKWHGTILVAVMHDPDHGTRRFEKVANHRFNNGLREVL
jgi:hypothetical protein